MSPAVGSGRVIVGADRKREMAALATDSGRVLWRTSLDSFVKRVTTMERGLVIVGGQSAVYALRERTGDLAWKLSTEDVVTLSPVVVGETIVCGSLEGVIYRIDAETGDAIWTYASGQPQLGIAPTVSGGRIFVGISPASVEAPGTVTALDLETGDPVWKYETAPGGTVMSKPAVYKDLIIFGSLDGHVYAVSRETGDLRWRISGGTSISSSPKLRDTTVYISGDHVLALDVTSGERQWEYKPSQGAVSTATPVVAEDSVYLAGMQLERLVALSAQTGRKQWDYGLDGASLSLLGPSIDDESLYLGTTTGTVYAFSI